jgi:hypothetical protein
MDMGMGRYYNYFSGSSTLHDYDYFSLYPYLNLNLFLPFTKGGWFVGAGYGIMFSTYNTGYINDKEMSWLVTHSINFNTGFVFWNWLNLSLNFKLGFYESTNGYSSEGFNFNVSAGYVWRFL